MASPTSIYFSSALELGRLLRKRKIGARELLDLCWKRYEACNPRLNAIVVTEIARACRAADAADRRLKSGEALSPIDGLPMTIKESFGWIGTPSTWGAPAHRHA